MHNEITFYDPSTGMYTNLNKTIESKQKLSLSQQNNILQKDPQTQRFILKKFTTNYLCESKLRHHLNLMVTEKNFSLYTDAFYNRDLILKDINYFLDATYICHDSFDYYYFKDILGLKTLKMFDKSLCTPECFLVNPTGTTGPIGPMGLTGTTGLTGPMGPEEELNILYTIDPKIKVSAKVLCCIYNDINQFPDNMGQRELPYDLDQLNENTIYFAPLRGNKNTNLKVVLYGLTKFNLSLTKSLVKILYQDAIKTLNYTCQIKININHTPERINRMIKSTSDVKLFGK